VFSKIDLAPSESKTKCQSARIRADAPLLVVGHGRR
jgi:hypothetical protein